VHGWIVKNGLMEPKWSGKTILPVDLVDILDTIDHDEAKSDSEDEGQDNSDLDMSLEDSETGDESNSDF